MKKLARKDYKNRKANVKFVKTYKILKSFSKNYYLTKNIRWNANLTLTELPKNQNENRLVNRCIFTYRKSAFRQLYSISRILFLKLARQNQIYGIKKNVW